MKTTFLLTVIFSLSFNHFITSQVNNDNSREFQIEEILSEIQIGLVNIQKELSDSDLPPLKSVELTLETIYKKVAGGRIKILIFSFGRKWEKEVAQKLNIVLTPPTESAIASLTDTYSSISNNLVEVVVAAANGVRRAKLNQKVPLETSKLVAEIKFTVMTGAEAGVDAEWVFAPLSASISSRGELNRRAIHTINVTFEEP